MASSQQNCKQYRNTQPTDTGLQKAGIGQALEYSKSLHGVSHSHVKTPTAFLLSHVEELGFSCEKTEIGLSYLYQPAAPSPLFPFGTGSQTGFFLQLWEWGGAAGAAACT